MALSLVCNDCGLMVRRLSSLRAENPRAESSWQLRSVAEAQAHSEASKHTNFAESTAPVTTLVCEACGKPCRSPMEQEMHTRRNPGHTTFADRTGEGAKPMDTEQQMADAAADSAADAAALLAAFGKTAKAKPAAAATASAGTPADSDSALVPAEADASLVAQLVDMGFPQNRVVRALRLGTGPGIEGAVAWLDTHANDAGIDEPLMVPAAQAAGPVAGPVLTAEEAKAAAAELVRKAKAKKEADEKESERLREKERVRSGKELLAAKRIEDDAARKRDADARRREKEEVERAHARIKEKLDEDRRERRRKAGLPEDPTPEELAAKAAKDGEAEAKKAAAAAEAAARSAARAAAAGAATRLRGALVAAKKAAPSEAAATAAFATLGAYVNNAASGEEKYRTIKLTNAAFQARVGAVPGTVDFLVLCGFAPQGDCLVMGAPDLALLASAAAELQSASTNPFFGVL